MSDLGRFTWYELMSADPEGGLDFYGSLVGWGRQAMPGNMPYTLFTIGERPVAGCMQLPAEAQQDGAPTHWLGYVHTDDIESAISQAGDLGASMLHRVDVPEIGKAATLHDPQQAVIGLYQPDKALAPEGEPQVGEFSWHELATSDYEAAFDFYSKMFGWEIIDDMDMGEYGVYRIFGRNGQQLGGMFNRPPEMPASAWLYYTRVDSCDADAARIATLGGQVVNGPMDVPGGDRIAQGVDPQGGMFALHSKGQQAAEG